MTLLGSFKSWRRRKVERVTTELDRPLPLSADPCSYGAPWSIYSTSIKFSPPGSTIRVRASASARQAELSIQDQGPGISTADQAHVFDRFFRVDRARSRETDGVGLGLAIARWGVDAHCRTIAVESKEGNGSTFRITLPLS